MYIFNNVSLWSLDILEIFLLGAIPSTSGVHKNEGMTVSELKQHVEDWMSTKFQVTLKYDPTEAIKQLENFGLLVTKQRGMPQPVLFISKMIVSLLFVQKILNNFNTYCEMINSVISIGPNSCR